MDSYDASTKTLIISGAMDLVDQKVGTAVASASLTLENLGTIANKSQAGVLDLGDNFN